VVVQAWRGARMVAGLVLAGEVEAEKGWRLICAHLGRKRHLLPYPEAVTTNIVPVGGSWNAWGNERGETVPDALNALEERCVLFIAPGKGSTTAMPPGMGEKGLRALFGSE
jgi:hypothetical protein